MIIYIYLSLINTSIVYYLLQLIKDRQLVDHSPDPDHGRQNSGPRQHIVLSNVVYCNTFINVDDFFIFILLIFLFLI